MNLIPLNNTEKVITKKTYVFEREQIIMCKACPCYRYKCVGLNEYEAICTLNNHIIDDANNISERCALKVDIGNSIDDGSEY